MRRHLLLTLGFGLLVATACEPTRLRPGPPRLNVELPNDGSVTSPDTIIATITATDNDGLDSLTVNYLGNIVEVNTGFDVQTTAEIELTVPSGLPDGTLLVLSTRARDIRGQTTEQTDFLRVESSP